MKKKNRTAKCGHTQPSTSIRTDRVVPPALREQYGNNGVGTQLPASLRRKLRHRDRWRMRDMLTEREKHGEISDIELWRRLYLPGDLVRVGDMLSPAQVAPPAEYCCGCTWSADGTPRDTVSYCLSAADLLSGASSVERMNPQEAGEAVLGRIRAANLPILLVVEDGEGLLEVWVDAWCGRTGGRVNDCEALARGRCPGGINSRTGRVQRVLWAYAGLWEPWKEEELAVMSADGAPDWLEAHLDRLIAWRASWDSRKEVT